MNPRPPDLEYELCNSAEMQSVAHKELLPRLVEFCGIDRKSAEGTIDDYCEHLLNLGRFLESLNKYRSAPLH